MGLKKSQQPTTNSELYGLSPILDKILKILEPFTFTNTYAYDGNFTISCSFSTATGQSVSMSHMWGNSDDYGEKAYVINKEIKEEERVIYKQYQITDSGIKYLNVMCFDMTLPELLDDFEKNFLIQTNYKHLKDFKEYKDEFKASINKVIKDNEKKKEKPLDI